MTFTFNDTDRAVQEFLNSNNVKYGFNYIGPVASKEWAHDLFTVSFVAAGKEPITAEYKTGIGHRLNRTKKGGAYNMMKFDAVTGRHLSAHREALEVASNASIYFPVDRNDKFPSLFVPAPTAASVLFSLLSDMDCGSYTFADFCANFGYDEDSRKSHAIYLACQESGNKLRRVFNGKQLTQLQELLQDY